MSKQLNWGILGTGSIAHTFARALSEAQTGTLVAVGSRTKESAEKFGAEFNVANCHGSYDELLADPQVEAIYIATPHPSHAEWAIKCAGAGKHILCEKPLTMNAPEAMAVVEAARANDVFLMEAFMYRCHPQTKKLVELIREGAIGEVRLIDAKFSFHGNYDPNSRLINPELGGGGILDVGCYCASMARLIAGAANGKDFAEPQEVKAIGQLNDLGTDNYTGALLKFPGGIIAQLWTGVQVNSDSAVRIFGSKGSIHVPSPWFCGATDGQIKIFVESNGERREEIIDAPHSLYVYEIDTVAAGIEARQAASPAMTPDDSLGNMQVLDLWRKEIGLLYPDEKEDAKRPTAHGRALKLQPGRMKYGEVAGVDKPVSRLVLGTMLEGSTFRMPQASMLFDDFVERGGNCFDTAHVYGSEAIVGQWLANRGVRDELVLIVKGAHTPDCYPEALTRQFLNSLDKLQTGYADIYMMHRDNEEIPVGEFVECLNEHVRAGRIKSFGGSNWSLKRISEANAYAREKGLQGFASVSNNFSLARMVNPVWHGSISTSDPESRAWFEKEQMPLFAWSSQARGFFVRGDRNFTADGELARCWYSDDNFQRLERVQQMAKERGVTPIALAAAYVLNQPFPTWALIGPRAPWETRTSIDAFDIELSPQDVKWLNLEA